MQWDFLWQWKSQSSVDSVQFVSYVCSKHRTWIVVRNEVLVPTVYVRNLMPTLETHTSPYVKRHFPVLVETTFLWFETCMCDNLSMYKTMLQRNIVSFTAGHCTVVAIVTHQSLFWLFTVASLFIYLPWD